MAPLARLAVLLTNDDGGWFAQGLEVDYAAEGQSMEDVKARFEEGIRATAQQHLSIWGDTTKMIQPAPAEIWKRILPHHQTFRATHRQSNPDHRKSPNPDGPDSPSSSVMVPPLLPFGPFEYIQEVKLMRPSGDISVVLPIVVGTLKRHNVATSTDEEHRDVFQKGHVLQVHRLPWDVHANMLDHLARRFAFEPISFLEVEEDLWKELADSD